MLGLVFSGGGGKGAYEVGVWRALEESGIAEQITSVSGTSVGALNGAMFASGDLRTAEKVWESISPDKVLTTQSADLNMFLNTVSEVPVKNGVFTQNGLKQLIDENVKPLKIRKFRGAVYAACSEVPYDSRNEYEDMVGDLMSAIENGKHGEWIVERSMRAAGLFFGIKNMSKVRYFDLTTKTDRQIKEILLASAAIPFIFSHVKIDGKLYADGGLCDNTPIKPLYDNGIKNIIVVYLNHKKYTDKKEYPYAKIIDIVPSEDLGNKIKGTMNFNGDYAERLMELGYRDALRVFRKEM